jgi:hypothetical protein
MKTLRSSIPPTLFSLVAVFWLAGCYTQLATTRDERTRYTDSYREEVSNQEADSAYEEEDRYGGYADPYDDYWRTRSRFMFRYYYPSFYSSWAYDPWYSDCYYAYDPWICGTPFVSYPYWYSYRMRPWYYSSFYSSPYSYYYYRYPYYGGHDFAVVSSAVSRTRDSGYRRSGESDGYDRSGTGRSGSSSGSSFGMPASRSGSASAGAVSRGESSTGRTRSSEPAVESRGNRGGESTGRARSSSTGNGSYTPPSRSSGGSRQVSPAPAPSSRGNSSGGQRSSGSSRGRNEYSVVPSNTPPAQPAPSPSYSPSPAQSYAPPPAASAAPASSGGSRSSGATRGRD